ncbi:hypothetical protein [Formosa sp. A9]|uniref:hypothetical protein n=1 Tax=Formosa sp. A9 TaxID=3442641 RepID=UPI003EB7FAFB
MKDKNYLYNMFNATATDDGKGDIETYENWLERQLLERIERLEQLDLHSVSRSLSASEVMDMSNRFIQNLIDNGWELNSEQQTKLTDAYVNSMMSEL